MKANNYHRECGQHSGIPECCINWFIGSWLKIKIPSKEWSLYWNKNHKDKGVEYIRCPACIKDSIVVKVKECNCESR